MIIQMAGPADYPAWDGYVRAHPQGLAYQMTPFFRTIHQAYGFGIFPFMARTGTRIQGVLPLVHLHLPGRRGALISLPYCDAAGVLADSPALERTLVTHVLAHARDQGFPLVSLRCQDLFASIPPDLTCYLSKVRMVLELPRQACDLMASFKAKVRSQVKKPLRDGLTCTIGGRELLHPFFKIIRENMRDLGSLTHSAGWFQSLMAAFGSQAHIGVVWLPNGQAAAAGLILCHARTVSLPWASSLRRFNRLNPNMLLYWSFLSFAVSQGYQQVDFGRSSPGEGTFRFKKQWGARPHPLHWVDFDPHKAARSLSLGVVPRISEKGRPAIREKAEAILSRFPVSLLTFLAGHTRKYISL